MARPLRIEIADAIYHVMSRGNEKRNIFRDDNDYTKFLTYLSDGTQVYRYRMLAYVLMPNHYHVMLQTIEPNLSRAMHHLNTAYTVYFNKRHNRVGHLFQGRYKAILIQKNPYLLEVSRYIHLNALRAGLITDLLKYRWSSYHYYVRRRAKPRWLEVNDILEMLSENPRKQSRLYKRFVEDGFSETSSPFEKVYAQTILGEQDFVDEVMDMIDLKKNQEIPASRKLIDRYGFDNILSAVSRVTNKSTAEILDGGRFSLERKILIYFLRVKTAMSLKEIGERFGISYSAVSQTKKIFESNLQQDESLIGIVRKINELLES